MRLTFLILFVIKVNGFIAAQTNSTFFEKPSIDTTTIKNWPSIGEEKAISNDGKYFMYAIENKPIGNKTLIIKSTSTTWEREIIGDINGVFTNDSKQFILLINDTLNCITLGTNDITLIANISDYKLGQNEKEEWLACHLKNESNDLLISNLLSGNESRLKNVTDYSFKRNKLFFKTATGREKLVSTFEYLDMTSLSKRIIWTSTDNNVAIANYTVSNNGNQVAFTLKSKKNNNEEFSIWLYKNGMERAVEKVNNHTSRINNQLVVSSSTPKFSEDDKYIYFILNRVEVCTPKLERVSFDLWNYKDTLIQSTQLLRLKDAITSIDIISVESDSLIQLTGNYEVIVAKPVKGDFVVVSYNRMRDGIGDMYWLPGLETYFLVSLKDGSRKRLNTNVNSVFWFSPCGHYLLYYDPKTRQYNSYNLQSGKLAVLSTDIPNGWLSFQSEYYRGEPANMPKAPANGGVAGCWLDNDRAVWVYDNYDIWQLDLAGEKPPLNITHGYGRSHHIKLRLTDQTLYDHDIVHPGDSLLLVAYNTENKYNGFYRLIIGSESALESLVMGPWTWYHLGLTNDLDEGMRPLKARNVNTWIVKRQTSTEFPNFFLTTDFRSFQPLTDFHPEKYYNWLTAELISWKQLDGTVSQGVLYKPQNFDPRKRYPVLIHYYEQMSHRLYEYPAPEFSYAEPNISWFVSKGYLVFTPDIYYSSRPIGESAKNTMISGAEYLGHLPYVDGKRIGIAGHSFGGHETYYLLTHTDKFAAVLASAGCTNVISETLSLSINGGSNANWMSSMEQRMGGVALWQNSNLYIDESAVFFADKITTPLLILQNKNDDHWSGGVALFIALRRLNKKVWMLQYDGEGHILAETKDQIDFTIRMTQFFDHYLKFAPAPKWLTEGIPAKLKQIETGYALDPSGNCGKDCKVCKMWNEKMKKDSVGTMIEIQEKIKSDHWMVGTNGNN
ncbi:MAG: prolyl oligopeptidase family serine peptidase [Chitinophagaceae bacterium]